jgi:hypothetical protein
MTSDPHPSDTNASTGSGPVLQLLSRGLQLWLRSQCEAIDHLELELLGSARELLRGRLAGVRVRATGVTYRQLTMASVELTSTPLELQLGPLWRGRTPALQQPFRINGTARFDGDGLTRSLAGEPWRQLGDQLIRQLVERGSTDAEAGTPADGAAAATSTSLQAVQLEGETLTLLAVHGPGAMDGTLAVAVELELEGSSLAFRCSADDGQRCGHLPLDPSLQISSARVAAGQLLLSGEAAVSPG